MMKKIKNLYKIIVTSGPTREYIDPIRFISNPSTGKMGYYIAKASILSGFQNVVYICGPAHSEYRTILNAQNIPIETTEEMLQAVMKNIDSNCVLIMSAAPADYRPEKVSPFKLKKIMHPVLSLTPTKDILMCVKKYVEEEKIENFFGIGFAAETDNAHEQALKKLKEKNLDMIFLNQVSKPDCGFGWDTNRLTLFRKDGFETHWPLQSKETLGSHIIKEVEYWLELQQPSTTKLSS